MLMIICTTYPPFAAHNTKALGYAVPFKPCFEPYVVVDKTVVPMYDERFRGYGMNKVNERAFASHQTPQRTRAYST